jgi:hypothetical protein
MRPRTKWLILSVMLSGALLFLPPARTAMRAATPCSECYSSYQSCEANCWALYSNDPPEVIEACDNDCDHSLDCCINGLGSAYHGSGLPYCGLIPPCEE